MDPTLLQARDLTFAYGDVNVLRGIGLTLVAGEVVTLTVEEAKRLCSRVEGRHEHGLALGSPTEGRHQIDPKLLPAYPERRRRGARIE